MNKKFFFSILFLISGFVLYSSPRIFNIVNFIRNTDYRLENSEALLYEAVEKQVELVSRYQFPATFLFQYDALINPRYQQLMKGHLPENCELGAWWEITQPQVEAAGLSWRGQYSWVSTAHIAFTPGYTQAERAKLVDVYMKKFREIYGSYPKAVGSWFIDSYTLKYMYDKYGIVASCNCKDQVGTDGYTLWGGYWNQAYYPSVVNAYMPAQTKEGQIPVPVFRMLGSDPIYQYDSGIGTNYQQVISMEPVYPSSGGDSTWVDYFLQSMVNEPGLAFSYAQVGQENSFTWAAMRDGLLMQSAKLDLLCRSNKIRLETLSASGTWFRKQFELTPATAVTTLADVAGNKSVWYNSRYYRTNLFWEKDGFCFRDIHLFDENVQSQYYDTPGEGNQFFYYTLPVVDRFFWSNKQEHIGLRIIEAGSGRELILTNPQVRELSKTVLQIKSSDEANNHFTITLSERTIEVSCKSSTREFDWAMELRVPSDRLDRLPFRKVNSDHIMADFQGHAYTFSCDKGIFSEGKGNVAFRVHPDGKRIRLVVDSSLTD